MDGEGLNRHVEIKGAQKAIARYTDNNNYLAAVQDIGANTISIVKRVGGSNTVIGTPATGSGDKNAVIGLTCNGGIYKSWVNGVEKATYTDGTPGTLTGTKVGFAGENSVLR